jgi:hypothetical protein
MEGYSPSAFYWEVLERVHFYTHASKNELGELTWLCLGSRLDDCGFGVQYGAGAHISLQYNVQTNSGSHPTLF